MQEGVLFSSGSAELLEGGKQVLSRLLLLLSACEYLISVQGHTDSVPISTDRFPSNWELSGARAAAVVRELIALGIEEKSSNFQASRIRIPWTTTPRHPGASETAGSTSCCMRRRKT